MRKNIKVYFDNKNYLLLEENINIPLDVLEDLRIRNLEPINPSFIENYWISDNFSFILCRNIYDNRNYFYIFNQHNNNELINIVLNEYEENKNVNSKYYCCFEYNNVCYYIIYHLFVLFNQFIIHTETIDNFNQQYNKEQYIKEQFINSILNTFKFN